jgi:hypothetical protein
MTTLFDPPKENIPRLNQCYICKTWTLEKDLDSIEIPDQAGYVQKQACKKCLSEIMAGSTHQDGPESP